MKLDTVKEGQNNPIVSIYGVISLPIFCNIKFVQSVSESIKENQMKPDTLRDRHQR